MVLTLALFSVDVIEEFDENTSDEVLQTAILKRLDNKLHTHGFEIRFK